MPSQANLQTTWNLIEAINDAHQDAKAFRTHCLQIFKKVEELNRTSLPLRNAPAGFATDEAARDAIEPLNAALEECLSLLRKCATIGVMEKMFDKGETKGNLEAALHRLTAASQLFSTWQNVAKSTSDPNPDNSKVAIEHHVENASEVRQTEENRLAKGLAVQSTISADLVVDKRPSPSQVYPDLL